jgi:hypothetical protein
LLGIFCGTFTGVQAFTFKLVAVSMIVGLSIQQMGKHLRSGPATIPVNYLSGGIS